MKYFINNFFLLLFLMVLGSCSLDQTDAVPDFAKLDIDHPSLITSDEFNEQWKSRLIGHDDQHPATPVLFTKEGKFVSYEVYWNSDDDMKQNFDKRYILTSEFLDAIPDPDYKFGLVKPVPLGELEEHNMWFYDFYADRQLRMTLKEEAAEIVRIQEVIAEYQKNAPARIDDPTPEPGEFGATTPDRLVNCTGSNGGALVWNDQGKRITSGDMLFQWGLRNPFTQSTPCPGSGYQGASTPGHVSMVSDNDRHPSRLDRVWIVEAWGGWTCPYPFICHWGYVEKKRAHCTWGWASGASCVNYWGNNYTGSSYWRNRIDAFMNEEADEPDLWWRYPKGYGVDFKSWSCEWWQRPGRYYCSLFAWQTYKCTVGWDIDRDGGTVVYPNDVHRWCFSHSNVVGQPHMVYGDF